MVKKQELQTDERGAYPCKHCLKKKHKNVYPIIKEIEEMFYIQCPECTNYDPYEFLALNKKRGIQIWNNAQTHKNGYSDLDED